MLGYTTYVDRFAGNATFLLWASQTFSELAAARPSHGLPDRTLATEAWAALLCTMVLPPGDDPARGRGAAGADADRPLAQDRRRRTAATRGGASAVRPQQGVAHQFAAAAWLPVQLVRAAGHAVDLYEAKGSPGRKFLIAGKGHEPYQEINGVRHPFSDVEQTRAALEIWNDAQGELS